MNVNTYQLKIWLEKLASFKIEEAQ